MTYGRSVIYEDPIMNKSKEIISPKEEDNILIERVEDLVYDKEDYDTDSSSGKDDIEM